MGDEIILSHVNQANDGICNSIRSNKKKNERCINPATHGRFCGIHCKNPKQWSPSGIIQANKIQQWYKTVRGLYFLKRHGIGYWNKDKLINDTDFFSTDPLSDLSGIMFISYMDSQKHIYGFDIRSVHSLFTRAITNAEPVLNPYTRNEFPESFIQRKSALVDILKRRNISVDWVQLHPPTPEQQWRMKVVDIFNKIDELSYYSSPDWFISLNHYGHAKYYRELYEIWNTRAGLSSAQKSTIVPQYQQRLFRYSPWLVSDQPIATIQKINMNTIRILISSAEDRNDRILGAMYVITAFTMVSRQARTAYPWLYESVSEIPLLSPMEGNENIQTILGFHWLQNIINLPMLDSMPMLMLPANATNSTEEQPR